MSPHQTQSFFTPPPHSAQSEPIPAPSYNLAHTLLNRSGDDHLFVPIRSAQILAIIEPEVIWFVDSMAYAVQQGEGGRMIVLSWRAEAPPTARNSLEQPVPCTITHYGGDHSSLQTRLRGEFLQAMQQLDQRYRDKLPTTGRPKILPFTAATTA